MTTANQIAHPKIVSRQEWLAARKQLLSSEKELTRHRDAVSAERRRLPVVRIEKPYVFHGPAGKTGLAELFDRRRQLIVYHFMFDPADPPAGRSGAPWEEGCPGCSFVADNIGHLAHLHARDTTLVMVSRAPFEKIAPFQARMGWTVPWYSSFGSEFNYDFHATLDAGVCPVEYNYQDEAALVAAGHKPPIQGECPGISVFLRLGDEVFHTYSSYARGLDPLDGTYQYLDLTPFGRQEEWEDSPEGWPRTPTHSWLRHHDRYPQPDTHTCCGS